MTSRELCPAVLSADLQQRFTVSALVGRQILPKGKSNIQLDGAAPGPSVQDEEVYIVLVVVRMPVVSTDLCVCMNLPSAHSAWLTHALRTASLEDILAPDSLVTTSLLPREPRLILSAYDPLDALRVALRSLVIKDWALFA